MVLIVLRLAFLMGLPLRLIAAQATYFLCLKPKSILQKTVWRTPNGFVFQAACARINRVSIKRARIGLTLETWRAAQPI